MVFAQPAFIAFAIVAASLLRRVRDTTLFTPALGLTNLAFLLFFFTPAETLALGVVAGLGYALVLGVRRRGRGAMLGAIFILIASFVTVKGYAFAPSLTILEGLPAIVGFSYLVFRLIHMVVDSADGRLPPMGPLDFLAYGLFYLSLLSGPIQRYQDFQASKICDDRPLDDVTRIVTGYVKLVILSPLITYVTDFFVKKSSTTTWAGIDLRLVFSNVFPEALAEYTFVIAMIAAGIVWFFYLYVNFSGYMDIVVGFGRRAGFQLPENFDRPFSATNYLEFWNRWHMTLGQWFRTYVFGPFYKALVEKAPRLGFFQGVIALFVTFVLVGAWHGTTWPFLFCGLLFGIGAAANKGYQEFMLRRLGKKKLRQLNARPVYQDACRGFTFAYLSLAIMPFWMSEEQYGQFLASERLIAICGATTACLILSAILVGFVRRLPLSRVAEPWGRLRNRIGENGGLKLWTVAAAINAIVIITFVSYRQLPNFVYQGF